jgi:hypothetical protein
MPVHLIFLFLFQSSLAFAFSYFIARIILSGSKDSTRQRVERGLRVIRRIVVALALVLPFLMFIAYYQSLPEGQPTSLAVWPAAWIFMILAAVAIAITIALARPSKGESAI